MSGWPTYFSRLRQQWLPAYRASDWQTRQPLLDAKLVLALRGRARNSSLAHLAALREVRHPMLGEKDSAFTGSGYEFAEHRQYVSGDPVRHINWRIYARTGQLVRKVFHEQRRPHVYLVVDRRAPMRFATSRQLKVTCAVKHALLNLYQANILQLYVGAMILDEAPHWYAARQSDQDLHALGEHLVSPCPPLHHEDPQCSLEQALKLLALQIPAGSLVLLFSDFHDYHDDMQRQLFMLGEQHTVLAWHMLDRSEFVLPNNGHYLVQADTTDATLPLDCEQQAQRDLLQARLQEHKRKIEQALRAAQIQYHFLLSNDDEL